MSETVPALRGDSLRIRVADLTLNGLVWADVADYNPTAQLRVRPRSALVAEFAVSVDDGDLVLDLTAEETEALDRPLYVWDVQFVHPDTGAKFSWPPSGAPRNRLSVTSDVTRVEPAP